MLDDRRAVVLREVVQHYIETSQPVSSTSVVDRQGVEASSATVRAEMAALEREGFLRQPHTSAGRIPTDLGYRFFVDHLETTGDRLAREQNQDVRAFFDKASGEIETMLHQTGRLLSDLTGAASVVVGPDHDDAVVRSAQLVPLGPAVSLAVVVLSDGTVVKCAVELAADVRESDVVDASALLAKHMSGSTIGKATAVAGDGGKAAVLAETALTSVRAEYARASGNVHVGGTSLLASAFEAVEVVRNVLTILEQQFVVVTLMRDLIDRGVTVSIGREHQLQPLSECSLVMAPTIVDGEHRGSVAVLGPTRMDYSQALAAVGVVSRNLGERLGANRH